MNPRPTMPAQGKISLGVTLSLAAVIFVVSFGFSLLGLVVLYLLGGQRGNSPSEIVSRPVIRTELSDTDTSSNNPRTHGDDPGAQHVSEQPTADPADSDTETASVIAPTELAVSLQGISRFEETWTFAIRFSVATEVLLEDVRVAAVMKDVGGNLLGTQVLTPIKTLDVSTPHDDYLILPASSAEQVKEIGFRVTRFKRAGDGFESTASGLRIPSITPQAIAEILKQATEALPQKQAPGFLGNRPDEDEPSNPTSLLNSQDSAAAMINLFQIPETPDEKADLDQIVTRSIAELLTDSLPEVVSIRQKLPAGQVLSRSPRMEIPKIEVLNGQRFLHVLWGGAAQDGQYSGVFILLSQSLSEPDGPWKILLFLRSFDNKDPTYNHAFKSLDELTRWYEGLSVVQLQELTNALQP